MLPEHDAGCLIQFGEIRLTQCPLAIVARRNAFFNSSSLEAMPSFLFKRRASESRYLRKIA